jgi:hypothetical protein
MMDSDKQARERLPAAVYDLAIRLGANPSLHRPMVTLRQTGRMKDIGATRWMTFSATQTMNSGTCGFDWRARFGPLGLIHVRDAYLNGAGHLTVKALGLIPMVWTPVSAQLNRGELMRYLAELVWVPDAILFNTELRWRQDAPDKLAVSAGRGESAAEVTLTLDSEGRIAGAFAPDRARAAKPPYNLTPWRGRFWDYRRHQDMWLPFGAEVGWEIEGKLITYFQCQIEHWQSPTAST